MCVRVFQIEQQLGFISVFIGLALHFSAATGSTSVNCSVIDVWEWDDDRGSWIGDRGSGGIAALFGEINLFYGSLNRVLLVGAFNELDGKT